MFLRPVDVDGLPVPCRQVEGPVPALAVAVLVHRHHPLGHLVGGDDQTAGVLRQDRAKGLGRRVARDQPQQGGFFPAVGRLGGFPGVHLRSPARHAASPRWHRRAPGPHVGLATCRLKGSRPASAYSDADSKYPGLISKAGGSADESRGGGQDRHGGEVDRASDGRGGGFRQVAGGQGQDIEREGFGRGQLPEADRSPTVGRVARSDRRGRAVGLALVRASMIAVPIRLAGQEAFEDAVSRPGTASAASSSASGRNASDIGPARSASTG